MPLPIALAGELFLKWWKWVALLLLVLAVLGWFKSCAHAELEHQQLQGELKCSPTSNCNAQLQKAAADAARESLKVYDQQAKAILAQIKELTDAGVLAVENAAKATAKVKAAADAYTNKLEEAFKNDQACAAWGSQPIPCPTDDGGLVRPPGNDLTTRGGRSPWRGLIDRSGQPPDSAVLDRPAGPEHPTEPVQSTTESEDVTTSGAGGL